MNVSEAITLGEAIGEDPTTSVLGEDHIEEVPAADEAIEEQPAANDMVDEEVAAATDVVNGEIIEEGNFNFSFVEALNLFDQIRSSLAQENVRWTTIIDALSAAIERREVQQQLQQHALQSFAADCMHKVVFLLTQVPNAHLISGVENSLIKEALNLSAELLVYLLPALPKLLFDIAVLVNQTAFYYSETKVVAGVRLSGFPSALRDVAFRLAMRDGYDAITSLLERADFNWPGGEVISNIMTTLANEELCKRLSDSCKARLIAAVMTRMAAVSASAFVEEHEQHLSKVLPILSKLHHMIPISSIVAVKAEATSAIYREAHWQKQKQNCENIRRCIDKYLQQRLLYLHKLFHGSSIVSSENSSNNLNSGDDSTSSSNCYASKSIALSAWPLLDELIVEAGIAVPFPQSYVVSGAGSDIVNGIYHAVPHSSVRIPRHGDDSGVPIQFVKERSNPHEPEMSLNRCVMKTKAKWWFIGSADAEKPGTDKDMDYYVVITNTRQEPTPPALGWRYLKSGLRLHGVAPQPIVRPVKTASPAIAAPDNAKTDAPNDTSSDIATASGAFVVTTEEPEEMFSDRLLRWAVENKMVEYISKYRSVEGLKATEELLKFLAVNGALTSADAKLLFDLVATSEADVSKAAIEVVVKAASVMDSDVFGYLIQSMIDTTTPSALSTIAVADSTAAIPLIEADAIANTNAAISIASVPSLAANGAVDKVSSETTSPTSLAGAMDADVDGRQVAFDRIAQFVTAFGVNFDAGTAAIVELSNDSLRHLAQLLWQLSRVPATLWDKNQGDALMLQRLLAYCFYHNGCVDFASSCIQNCADAIRITSEDASSSSSSGNDDNIAQHRMDAEIESNLDALESLLYENCTPYILDKLSTSSVPQILFDEVKRYVEDQRASAVATPTSTTDTATASVFGKQLRKRLQLLKRFYTIDETISTPLALIERLSKLLNNSAVEIEEFYFFLQSPGVRSSTTELAAMRARGMQQSLFTAAAPAPATSTATTSNTQSSSSSSSASSSSTPAVVPAPTASYTMPYLMMPPNHSVDLTSKYHALRFQQLEVGMNSSLSQGYSQQAALQQCNDQLSGNSRIVESLSGQVESLTAKVDQLTSQLSSLTVALERICGHPSSQKKA